VEATAIVAEEVRELIRRRGVDPVRDPDGVRRLVEDAVTDYDERSLSGALPPLADIGGAVRLVLDEVAGFGPLQVFLDDPEVEELWVNEPGKVFIARGGAHELTTTILSGQEVRDIVERMLKWSGRRVDLSTPFVDAMLPDGSRLHVVIPDITREHWALNVRKFTVRASRLDDLVTLGTVTPQAAAFLEASVIAGLNILVSGGTQAGKTTLLNCLGAAVPVRERVITCEEVFELKVPLRDVVGMQCRQPSLEGTGEIPLRRLVKEALRMRPNRIIVGEVRQAESLDLSKWQRVNTGLNIRERRKRPSSRPDQGACVKVPRRFRPRELRRGRVSLAGAPGRARLAQWLCPMSACGGHCGMARVVAAACRRGRALVGWCLRGSWWPRAVAAAALPRPLLDGV
jgi:pilus assembly protein CpaF